MRKNQIVLLLVVVWLILAYTAEGFQESITREPVTGRLSLQVTLVNKELDIKPVPKHAFILEPRDKTSEPFRFFTGFDGVAVTDIPPGTYILRSENLLDFEGKSYEWSTELTVFEGQELFLELSNNNAIVHDRALRSGRRVAEETALFQQLRNGVVTVEGELGHGSGFIVDPRGLVLTNHHVIRSSKTVRVRFDQDRKVEAMILASDPQADVAVLWVNLEVFPEFVVLPLARPEEGEASVVEGEEVLAIGSPLSQHKILTVGIVSKVEDRVIISDINVNPGNSGGPLISSLGDVVGIVTFGEQAQIGPGISGIIRIEEAEDALQRAQEEMATASPPSAKLLPVEPKRKFPVRGLARAITDEDYEPKHYQFGMKKYRVTVMTPVLKWYLREQNRIDAARRKNKERKKKPQAVKGTFDPIADLRNWVEYIGEYEAVVQILAIPEIAETKGSIFWRSLAAAGGVAMSGRYKFKAEFYEMALLCDGVEVTPIGRSKIERVGQLSSYSGFRSHYTFEGFYTYPYEVFDPEKCRQLKLRVYSEADPSTPSDKLIDPKIVQQVWTDFEPYR